MIRKAKSEENVSKLKCFPRMANQNGATLFVEFQTRWLVSVSLILLNVIALSYYLYVNRIRIGKYSDYPKRKSHTILHNPKKINQKEGNGNGYGRRKVQLERSEASFSHTHSAGAGAR